MLYKLLHAIRSTFTRRRFESELDAELEDHIAKYADELTNGGLPGAAALAKARRELGAKEKVKDEVRDATGISATEAIARALRFAVRKLAAEPVFSLTVIGTLALGLGASTAIFSVVDSVLLRELPYPDADRIFRLYTTAITGTPDGYVAPRDFPPLAQDNPLIAAASYGYSNPTRIQDEEGLNHAVRAYSVSDQYFEVFLTPMFLGRSFEPGENQAVVLSHSTWRDLYHSDPDILNGPLPGTGPRGPVVVGVAPPDFKQPANAAYWQAIRVGANVQNLRGYDGFLRLKDGVTEPQILSNLAGISHELGPDPAQGKDVTFLVTPMLQDVVGDLGPTVLILFGASLLLLSIAALNVASLVFSRGLKRTRELAIRMAMGAGRRHLIATLVTETLLLTVIGGGLGIYLGMAAMQLLLRFAPQNLPRLDAVSLNPDVALFSIGATLVTALITGLLPAVRLSGTKLHSLLQDGGKSTTGGKAQQRIFSGLVIAEVGLAVMLVIGAGLLLRSYYNLSTGDPGFRPSGLLVARVQASGVNTFLTRPNPTGGYAITGINYQPVVEFYKELIARIEAIPGVEQVSTSGAVPLIGGQPRVSVGVVGRPADANGALPQIAVRSADPDAFGMLGIRLLSGRGLQDTDTREAPGAAVVNETYARRFFPDEDPIGHRLTLPDRFYKLGGAGMGNGEVVPDEVTIVGVLADARQESLSDPAEPSVYLPTSQWVVRETQLVIRPGIANPESLIPAIRAVLLEADPRMAPEFLLYDDVIDSALARQRMEAILISIFAVMALLLATVGIYGLIAYSVAQRMGEMAVRSAMGATAGQMTRLVVGRGLELGLAGAVAGVLGAVAARQVVASQLYEVSTLDPGVFVAVPLMLLGVALLASYFPSRRIAKADPAKLLRAD